MRGHDAERGATLAEYALLIALVTVVAMPAVGRLRGVILDRYERTIMPGAGPTDGPGPTEPPPPATTAPPSTSPPTTPPTTAPTTTTRPPTTTAPPVVASAAFTDVTSSPLSWYRWSGSAVVVVTDARGRPLAGASVEVSVTPIGGGSPRTVTVTTDASGRATVEVGPYDSLFGYGTTRADLAVTGVTPTSGTWGGTPATTTVRAP